MNAAFSPAFFTARLIRDALTVGLCWLSPTYLSAISTWDGAANLITVSRSLATRRGRCPFIFSPTLLGMGFLDKLRGKKDQAQKETAIKDEPAATDKATTTGRKIKKYTSEGKPVYE
jgi:hypothetical protein